MAELIIYDSRGQRLDGDDDHRNGDQRIKDFFFDGLRFAIDTLQREAILFFRARDDQSSRSEQYYAVYNYANRQELTDLPISIQQVVEDEEGMILDSSQDDTKVFDLLRSDHSPKLPHIDMEFRSDIDKLRSNGKPIRLSVSSYDDAYAAFADWFVSDIDRFAIAENATSSNLSSYDVVVDPTGHSEVTALGTTEQALESLRERRRERKIANGTIEEPTSTRRKAGLAMSAGLLGIGVIVIALLGSCVLLPGATADIPGSPCSVFTGESTTVTITSVNQTNATSFTVTGDVNGTLKETNQTAVFDVRGRDSGGNETVVNATQNVSVGSNFTTAVTFDRPVENATSLGIAIGGVNDTYRFGQPATPTPADANESQATEANATRTATTDPATNTTTTASDSNSGTWSWLPW